MGSLTDGRALVTAGGQGIGKAICQELLRHGADLAVHYYTSRDGAEEVVRLAQKAGRRAASFQADLTHEDETRRVVSECVGFLGGLDILINNAGTLVERRPLERIDCAYWNRVMDVNLTSMVLVTRECMPHLLAAGRSSIVNLSSLAGRNGGGGGALAYAAAKGAVMTWTRGLATEYGPKGVRVNAVAPGMTLGSRFHEVYTPPEVQRRHIASLPVGRAGTTDDIARAVVFLAAEYDGFVHGATLDVNGGAHYS